MKGAETFYSAPLFRRGVMKQLRFATCHPDRKHKAKGLCLQCYTRVKHRNYYRAHPYIYRDRRFDKNQWLRIYKLSAKKRHNDWQLTDEQFFNITEMPCWYCGTLPAPRNGIDRRDNTKGYVQGNVVPCCSDCNRAKLVLTEAKFLELIKRIHAYSVRTRTEWWA